MIELEIQERDREVRRIQADMTELNEVFRSVSALLQEQGEQIGMLAN